MQTGNGSYTVIQFKQSSTIIKQFSGSNTDGEMVALNPGSYTAKICADPNNVGVYFAISYKINGEPTHQTISYNKYVGGLRIKEINDYPNGQDEPINTKYEYKQFAFQERSSGGKAFSVEYTYPHYTEVLDPQSQTVFACRFVAQSSFPIISLNTIQGGNVFYSQVRVYKKDKSGYGYTDTEFYDGGQSSFSLSFPFAPMVSYDWIDGLVKQSIQYRSSSPSGGFLPVKKIMNTYKTAYSSLLPGPHESFVRGVKLSLLKHFYTDPFTGGTIQTPVYLYSDYYLYSSWTYPISTTEIEYDQSDTLKTATVLKKYHFDNPAHIEMTSEEIYNSKGDQQKEMMRYPLDFNTSYAYNSSPVVEQRTLVQKNGTDFLKSADLTLFKDGKEAFPEQVYKYPVSTEITNSSVPYYLGGAVPSGFEKRIDYAYDDQNNIIRSIKENKIITAYKWGYNKRYVTAGIQNASLNEFYHEDFEDSGMIGQAHTGNKLHMGNYTVNWTIPNSRSYVLSYWYFSNNTWQYIE